MPLHQGMIYFLDDFCRQLYFSERSPFSSHIQQSQPSFSLFRIPLEPISWQMAIFPPCSANYTSDHRPFAITTQHRNVGIKAENGKRRPCE